jgi:hypothetical protein
MGCDSFGTWVAMVYPTVRPADDEKVASKVRAFKADVKRIGSYGEVAAWSENDVD